MSQKETKVNLEDNIQRVNQEFQKFFYFTLLIPIIIFIASLFSPIKVSFLLLIIFTVVTIVINIIEFVLNSKKYRSNRRIQIFLMYFSTLSLSVMVTGFALLNFVPIFIIFVLPPLVSCVYLNRHLVNWSSAFAYILMIISVWFRSHDIYMVSKSTMKPFSQLMTFIYLTSGFTIESVFAYLVAIALSSRSTKILRDFKTTLDKKTQFNNQLEESKALLIESEEKRRSYNNRIQQNHFKIISFVAEVLGSHDLFTGNHIAHTRAFVVIIAEQMQKDGHYADILTDEMIQLYSTAAFMHDIGKVHVPEGILNKSEKFTPEEFELMKTHPAEGLKLLNYLPKIDDGKFNEIAKEMAYSHHEKWDGTGYPQGLVGEEIPLSARIMAAADVLDALISQRLYKQPMTIDDAMNVFRDNSGSHFEPCIVESVLNCRDKIEYMNREFKRKESSSNESDKEWWQNFHKPLNEKGGEI
ncbi:MAG: HD domain-containing protein [Treponemataceae bacterium]|nr:HD domain-containing protein [Treponemataceae bacterium]